MKKKKKKRKKHLEKKKNMQIYGYRKRLYMHTIILRMAENINDSLHPIKIIKMFYTFPRQ